MKIKDVVDNTSIFSFKNVDIGSVVKEFISLKESKSSPIDSIPARILKDHFDIFAH